MPALYETSPWLTIRLALLATALLSSLYVGLSQPSTGTDLDEAIPELLWGMLCVVPILMPLLMLFVLGTLKLTFLRNEIWTIPTHRSNPFRFREPLLFFHFAGYFHGASGLGYLISGFGRDTWLVFHGLTGLAGFAGILIAVRLCRFVFKLE